MTDSLMHWYQDGHRLCSIPGGTDCWFDTGKVDCMECLTILHDPAPALDDLAAVEEWLSA